MFENKVLASRYLLVKQLGQGSFGKTYLARDLMLPGDPECVVKKLHPIFQDSEMLDIARRLFETEAQALQKLGDRERIPQLLAYFEENKEFYLVMQYIEGKSLQEALIPDRPWPEAKVIILLKNCLDILDYVHSQGVIHRDIKPANIICRQKDNKLFLVDFGAVKEVILARTTMVSQPTVAIGTRGYMPDEQATGHPTFNSDIYALGVIGIQALTGCSPLKLETNRGEFIWQQKAKVSPDLAQIISKMTRHDRNKRYRAAKEVIEAIDRLRDNSKGDRPNSYKKNGSTTYVENPNLSRNVINAKENDIYNSVIGQESTLIPQDSSASSSKADSTQSNFDRPPEILEESSSQTDTNNPPLSREQIDFLKQELADYIGPLSTLILKEILTKNPQINIQELIDSLAGKIPDSNQAKKLATIIEKSSPKINKKNSPLSPKASQDFLVGQTLENGKYLIKKKLGEGGFGTTYLAVDLLRNEPVAIKTVIKGTKNSPDRNKLRKQFLDEARRLLKCQHPNIVNYRYFFLENDLPFIVMDYVRGSTLEEIISKKNTLSEELAIEYIRQVGEALKVIHRNGLLHRDVKPQNLILNSKTKQVVLIDFGIAREFLQGKTQIHTHFTSDGYSPLEQYFPKAKRSSATDVYSLAATLYTLLTGQIPIASILRDRIPMSSPKEVRSDISQRVSQAVMAGMAIDAKDRPATVDEWLNLLTHSETDKYDSSLFPEQIELAQQELANYVGPLSTFIVRDTLTKNPQITLPQLIEKLATEIPDPDRAKQFTTIIKKFKTDINNAPVSPEQIELAQQELANYVGPLSTFIVRDTLTKNPQITLEELIEKLAAEIPDSDRGKEFTTIMKKFSSKTDTNNATVSPEQIELAQQELANYVGPLSTFIVRDTLTKNPQITRLQLIESLASKIPNSRQAKRFIKNLLSRF